LDEPPIVRTENLTKTYMNGPEKVLALENVSLQARAGELLALYGPSGSGKTTLLFLLAGFDRPSSGRIFLNEVEISSLNERQLSRVRRNTLGFVFQNYNLVEELSAVENVKLTMMFEGRPEKEMMNHALELLHQVGLDGKEARRPSQLSAGEQQRVAIARAIANGPRIVLMDEPTGNLDQENAQDLMQLVSRILREERVTFIIATHNPDLVEAASSRLCLKAGRVVGMKRAATCG
jgi:putative ABC transport system ATP-binding protein